MAALLTLATALPFVVLLLAIALAPLVTPQWWHHNRNKAIVVFVVSVPILIYLGIAAPQVLIEKLHEYFGFIVVIGALFVITGGVHIQGSFSGTPLVNTGMLGLGAVLANLLGTTGASVLLIRPLLRANKARKRVAHIVIFFIFIVANCGGLLTPIGDPPLLLGFLKGVPFDWTLRLWPQWLLVNGILLIVFNVWDRWAHEPDEKELLHEPLRVRGALSIVGLIGVLATILGAGIAAARGAPWDPGIQELAIVMIAVIAYIGTSRENRERNAFTFGPIIEVAILFAAIFVTMAPVLEMLNIWARGPGFWLSKPAHFFWASGTLSSVLDNAPTYLVFASSAAGLQGLPPHGPFIGAFVLDPGSAKLLAAISTGSVLMGANTYIGNAPNFMVRAIAQENGVTMPSFFGYMAYSVGILLPIFVVVSVVFF
ncbi:MAG TPA: sodium:proton antiporter [Gemmatimonadales bacterium]|nr:sodium:proton antiporter [Gemmatimonadales bacterium]